ncbi:MAG: GTP cyclohydrolase I FolE, partial [Flavobacteriaceae bacterium]|nr:GTP cyclohydrolase I FolE [Flavobacteriaceae bacterium]
MNENFNIETLPITEQIKTNYQEILHLLGENQNREGLLKTPERASKAMKFLTEGYEKDPKQILQSAMFKEDYNEMVIVKDIELYSLCEHHLLPFFGKAHIAYLPGSRVVGISKLARVMEIYAK